MFANALILPNFDYLDTKVIVKQIAYGLQNIKNSNVISFEPFEIAHSNFGIICILVT